MAMRNPGLSASEYGDSCSSAEESIRERIDSCAGRAVGAADDEDLLATRFVVSDELALESQDEAHVTIVNKASAARLKLSLPLYRFMLGFDVPRRIDQVVAVEPSSRFLAQVRLLVKKRMLVDVDAPLTLDPPRLRTAVAYKFCNAPGYAKSAVATDFVVLGVPYDLGGEDECRSAPGEIRQKSLDYTYRVEFDSGRPQGWFDVNRGAWILQGASIADAGDVYVDYGENQSELFDRIGAALEEAHAAGAVPVILGGDRSVTYAAVAHLHKRRALTVVQFAAVPAIAAGVDPNADVSVVAASQVGRRLLQSQCTEQFACFGGRDEIAEEAAERTAGCEGLIVSSASALRRERPDDVARRLGTDLTLHLSIDLSVTTAEYVRLHDAAAQGLSLHEIKALIGALGAAHRIASIDIVGLDTQGATSTISAVTACHLALAAMSAAFDRRRSGP